MKTSSLRPINGSRRGFTLVELLVTISIVAVLATLVFLFARRGMDGASASRSLSGIRQSGAILLADAQDKNGRFQFRADDGSAADERLPYNIVRSAIGLDLTGGAGDAGDLCEIMHWDPSRLKPSNLTQNCYGLNFTDVPDSGVVWQPGESESSGDATLLSLIAATVTQPGRHPLLVTSSTSTGAESSRVMDSSSSLVGLRARGRALAFMLDGSSRELDRSALKDAGFTRAYDNRTQPPTPVTL